MDFKFNKLSKMLGLEILNLDLKKVIDKNLKIKLNDLFVENKVLVIRKQFLNPNEFQKAAEIFGNIFRQHNSKFSLKENPLVHYISNQDKFPDGKAYVPGEGFHTDHSNDKKPPKATILLSKEIPIYGGDTQFVNMNQVFHPLVKIHPETGLKSLYINPIRIGQISNYSDQQTVSLIDELMEHVNSLKFEYRHKWEVGDFVVWDNRTLMHKANGDYDMSEKRYLYRLMLQDD